GSGCSPPARAMPCRVRSSIAPRPVSRRRSGIGGNATIAYRAGGTCRNWRDATVRGRDAGPISSRRHSGASAVNVLALVTDGFGGQGGIARYNSDLVTAVAQCGGGRIVVVPRQGKAPPSALPAGVRQLEPPATKPGYVLAAARAAVSGGPFDAIFCGHLHLAPLAAIIAGLLRLPLWLQLHGAEAWEPLARGRLWAAWRATLITAVSRHTRRRFLQL